MKKKSNPGTADEDESENIGEGKGFSV